MRKHLFNVLVLVLVTTIASGLLANNVKAQIANTQYEKLTFNEPPLYTRQWVIYHLLTEVFNAGLQYDDFIKLNKVVECESGYNVKAVGDGGKAYSLAQFWEKTFNAFKEEAQMDIEYKNPLDQMKLMIWAYKEHKMLHWTCWSSNFKDETQHF